MDAESTILTQELGKLGGLGARWLARLLPINAAEHSLEADLPEASIRRLILDLLGPDQTLPVDPAFPGTIRAIVGSGHGGLNPALLTITLRSVGSRTQIHVRGAAKEGLVRQRGGEQVARAFTERLAAALPTAT